MVKFYKGKRATHKTKPDDFYLKKFRNEMGAYPSQSRRKLTLNATTQL